jgi:hypothetical protein
MRSVRRALGVLVLAAACAPVLTACAEVCEVEHAGGAAYSVACKKGRQLVVRYTISQQEYERAMRNEVTGRQLAEEHAVMNVRGVPRSQGPTPGAISPPSSAAPPPPPPRR